jgi:hypothetical protein
MSFHEKAAWACLIGIVAVYVPYFWVVFRYPMAFGLFVVAAVVLAAVLTAFHLVNAIATPSIRRTGDVPTLDELDRAIELRASKLSGFVLAASVMVWCLVAMFGVLGSGSVEGMAVDASRAGAAPSRVVIPVTLALTGIHTLFSAFVIANVAYYGGIVAGYRRLAHG